MMKNLFKNTAKLLIERVGEAEKTNKEVMELSYSKERIVLHTEDDMIILSPLKKINDLNELIDYLATLNIMVKAINNDLEYNKTEDKIDIILEERHRIRNEIDKLGVLFLQTILKGFIDE